MNNVAKSISIIPWTQLNGCRSFFLQSRHSYSTQTLDKLVPFLDRLKLKCQYAESSKSPRDKLILKTYQNIEPLVESLNILVTDLKELKLLAENERDPDLQEIAKGDILTTDKRIHSIKISLLEQLAPLTVQQSRSFDSNDAILEVQAGAGGQEAGLFAQEIFEMYVKFAQFRGLQADVNEYQSLNIGLKSKFTSSSGIHKASAILSGGNAFQTFKYECGVHRVQRVPITGTRNDRLQTSTCSVAVIPQPRESDLHINEKDCKFDFVRASGPGGQNVNKSESACRLIYIPSGIVIECQEDRTPLKNKKKAIQKLRNVLYQQKFDEEMKTVSESRKLQVGNMDRNEKIRTYNFNRHMITDHRLQANKTVPNLNPFFLGQTNFEQLIEFSQALQQKESEFYINELLQSDLK